MKTVSEVEKYIVENATSFIALSEFLKEVIANKKSVFSETDFKSDFKFLEKEKFINGEGRNGFYVVNYDNLLVRHCVLKLSELILKKELPKNIVDAIKHADEFCEEIRKPKINFLWHNGLSSNLEEYVLLYLHHTDNVNIVDFTINLTNEDRPNKLFNFEYHVCKIIPFLDIEIDRLYKLAIHIFDKPNFQNEILSGLRGLFTIDNKIGLEFYEFSKREKNYEFAANMLIPVYDIDSKKAITECIELLGTAEGPAVRSLTWMNYKNSADLIEAFEAVQKKSFQIASINNLPAFFTRILSNPHCPDEIINTCFSILNHLAFLGKENKEIRSELIFRTKFIKGHDDKKYAIFNTTLSWGESWVVREFFTYFEDPQYLFTFIKSAYTQVGAKVEFRLFESALHSLQQNNPLAFESEVLELISSSTPLYRFAGCKIIGSHQIDISKISLLKLKEEHQILITETFFMMPSEIERMLPFILQLRNSSFKTVKDSLTEEIKKLAYAYEEYLLEMLNQHLSIKQLIDKKIIETVKLHLKKIRKNKKLKSMHNELNPILNEVEPMEKYYRLEHELKAEMGEEVSNSGILATLAKKHRVIRGKGFKIEGKTEINILQPMASQVSIDARYYLNPEKYNWDFYNFFTKHS